MSLNFVYILRKGTERTDQLELRYSLRSVDTFHPDAKVYIVGEMYDWVMPNKFIAVKDLFPHKVQNTAWKAKVMTEELPDGDYVYMNDDFILLQPYRHATHYFGTLASTERITQNTYSGRVFKTLCDIYGPDWLCFDRHTPHSFSIPEARHVMAQTNKGETHAFKTLTGNINNKFPKIEIDYDAKINAPHTNWAKATDGRAFLSLCASSWSKSLHKFLDNKYPNKSRYERY